MTLFLDLRASDAGGLSSGEVTPREDFTPISVADITARVTGRDVVITTHGFNVNRTNGINELSNWEKLLSLKSTDLFVGLLWPGDSRWAPIVDYPIEGPVAIKSGALLASFLNQNFTGANTLSFVSHSLGARTVLETIRHLNRRVRFLTLMAGAIEDDCLIDEYQDSTQNIEQISLLASRGDEVLKLAFPLGNLLESIIAPTHPFFHAAIGRAGPQPPYPAALNKNWQIPDEWRYGHHNYLPTSPTVPRSAAAVLPPNAGTPIPTDAEKPAWSASFVSNRFDS